MGQVPAKYFLPPAPAGASSSSNIANPIQAPNVNPQTPLLPTGFTDPGTTVYGSAGGGFGMGRQRPDPLPIGPFMGRRMPYSQ